MRGAVADEVGRKIGWATEVSGAWLSAASGDLLSGREEKKNDMLTAVPVLGEQY